MTKESKLSTKYQRILYKDEWIYASVLEIKGRPHYEPEFLSIVIEGTIASIPLDIITKALKDYELELKNR